MTSGVIMCGMSLLVIICCSQFGSAAKYLEKVYEFSVKQESQIFDVPVNAIREIEVVVSGASSRFDACEISPMYINGDRITAKINIPTNIEKLYLYVGKAEVYNYSRNCRGSPNFSLA